MKKLLLILITIVGINQFGHAQSKWGEDSIKCRENLYLYYEYAKNKNYDDAYDGWNYVYQNCPASSKNNFIYGPYIVQDKIKKATDQTEKQKYIDLLMEVYNNRLKYFPGKEDYVKGKKALDMMKYMPDSNKAAYSLFKEAFEIGGPEQSAAFYNGFFISAARLFNDDIFDIADVFEAYNVVIEGIEVNNNALNREIKQYQEKQETSPLDDKEAKKLKKAERELERYEDVETNIEKILGPIATCEKLQLIYNDETFEAHKTDETWLRRATKMLSKERKNEEGENEDCTSNPIFFKIAEALYQIKPSAPSARGMGILAWKNNDYGKAIDYFKEAAEQEVDPKKQAKDYLKLAISYQKQGRLAEAKGAAVKAASLKKAWGDPYVIIATLYAQADGLCGNNVFEKKAVYWAAIDKLQYARSIDESVAAKANRLIQAYKKQLPDKGASFQLGHTQGEKHTIGCWINETITADFNL